MCEHPTQVAGWMWRRKLELELELELVTESGASSLQWPPVASHEIYALKLHNWATHTHRHRVTQTGETLHINSGSQGNGEKFLTRPHHELKLNSLGPYQIKHFLVLGRLLIEVRTRRCTDTRIQRSMCSDGRCTIQSTHDSILISCFGLFSLNQKKSPLNSSNPIQSVAISLPLLEFANRSFHGWINFPSFFFLLLFCCYFFLWHSKWIFCADSLIVFHCKLYLVLLGGIVHHVFPPWAFTTFFVRQFLNIFAMNLNAISCSMCVLSAGVFMKIKSSTIVWPNVRWLICDYHSVANGADGLEPIWAQPAGKTA